MSLVLIAGSPAIGDEDARSLYLQFGAYAHYSSRDDYEGVPVLIAAEVGRPQELYYGLALFDNSFGHLSQFVYAGTEWLLPKVHDQFRARLAFGIVHGDWGENELALSHNGFALGIVPSFGFKNDRYGIDLVILSNAAMMLSVGMDINL